MSRRTVYEDKALKEEKRRRKEEEYLKKHTVPCPHCGKDVLDSMTKCPSCKKEIDPKAYRPLDAKKLSKIKLVTFCVGMVIAVLVIYFLMIRK